VTIAVNASILKHPTADFYISSDSRVTERSHWNIALKAPAQLVLYQSAPFAEAVPTGRDAVFYSITKDPTIRADSTELVSLGTSAHVAIHLATVLGCTEIVLLGCDCRMVEGKQHYYEFPGQPVDTWHGPSRQDKGEGYCGLWSRAWTDLIEANPNLPIQDASGGELQALFPARAIETLYATA
jgi:hypothetical protein